MISSAKLLNQAYIGHSSHRHNRFPLGTRTKLEINWTYPFSRQKIRPLVLNLDSALICYDFGVSADLWLFLAKKIREIGGNNKTLVTFCYDYCFALSLTAKFSVSYKS